MTAKRALMCSALMVAPVAAPAQQITASLPPAADRWMYPFSSSPGAEPVAPVFGAIQVPGFDDRDAQFLIKFDTASIIPTGRPLSDYRVSTFRVRVTVARGEVAYYDPTLDGVNTLYNLDDPEYVPDADPGRAIELFWAGFRNGWTDATFTETSPFGGAPIIPPSEGARNVFAAIPDAGGVLIDVSRQVRQRFDATPLAVGLTDAVAPGQKLTQGAEIDLSVDLCDAGAQRRVAEALQRGSLWLIVSTLEPAQGGPGGGTGGEYPMLYTRENILGDPTLAPHLDVSVVVAAGADFNGDGFITGDDFDAYVGAFQEGDPAADFNADCFVTGDDFDAFVEAFERG